MSCHTDRRQTGPTDQGGVERMAILATSVVAGDAALTYGHRHQTSAPSSATPPTDPTPSATAPHHPTVDCAARMRLSYSSRDRSGLHVCASARSARFMKE